MYIKPLKMPSNGFVKLDKRLFKKSVYMFIIKF